MLKTMYGIDVTPEDEKYLPLLHEALEGPTETLLAGSALVEYVPVLQYLPAWFPGAGFQKDAAKWRVLQDVFKIAPFQETVKRSVSFSPNVSKALLTTGVGRDGAVDGNAITCGVVFEVSLVDRPGDGLTYRGIELLRSRHFRW